MSAWTGAARDAIREHTLSPTPLAARRLRARLIEAVRALEAVEDVVAGSTDLTSHLVQDTLRKNGVT